MHGMKPNMLPESSVYHLPRASGSRRAFDFPAPSDKLPRAIMPGAPAVTTLQRSRWRAAGGQELEGVLSSGAVAVVDAAYLIGVSTRDGEVLRHRQALPPEAFLSLEQMIAMTPLSQDVLLPIIVVSCAWLHPQHPDPLGAHLHTLAAALRLCLADANGRWGVVWDWCALHQHPDESRGELRTEREEALYQEGLLGVAALLSHPSTTVVQLTAKPKGYPMGYQLPTTFPGWATYHARAWPWAEAMMASLTKPSSRLLDLGKLDPGKLDGLRVDPPDPPDPP
jgi:hypothetical protein